MVVLKMKLGYCCKDRCERRVRASTSARVTCTFAIFTLRINLRFCMKLGKLPTETLEKLLRVSCNGAVSACLTLQYVGKKSG